MEEWKEYKIGDVCSRLRSGKNIKADSVRSIGKYPVIGGNGVRGYTDVSNFEGQAAVIGRQGAYCGNVRFFEGEAYMTEHAVVAVGNELADTRFLASLLSMMHLGNLSAQSAQPGVSVQTLSKQIVRLPPISYQKRVSTILKSLDDKISLNKRINDNLEQQAQALFKHWFIDFGPFKDGEFVESELGMIPKGWRVLPISEIPHSLETGKRPSGGVKGITKGIPSIGAENIKGLSYYDYSKTKFIPSAYAKSMKKGKINGYELLIYKDGGRPGYFIPNFTIFGEGFPYKEMYLNEHVFKLDFFNKEYSLFCYFYFNTKSIITYLNAQGSKAAVPGINSKDIESIPILSPDNKIVKDYCDAVKGITTQILIRSKESRHLATLRDTLLPKLMSGQIKL